MIYFSHKPRLILTSINLLLCVSFISACATTSRLDTSDMLLMQQISGIKKGTSHNPQMYFLGVAGYQSPSVFSKEVKYVRSTFDLNMGTSNRDITLSNDARDINKLPQASRQTLEKSINGIAAKMDLDKDILAIYMSSHGDPDGNLVLALSEYVTQTVSPAWLKRKLDQAGIRWRLLIVSSCYSGAFADTLASPEALVITAADAKNTSFGCGAADNYTWFGEAFFVHQNWNSRSFHQNFIIATTEIKEKEQHMGFKPSNPQFREGPFIKKQLGILDITP
ncbi:hypothetical protein HNQ50_001472 [Silvimonas terrae]|uniref:Peptidase C13 family protein n=1 Tax=Silvimonas terrae TaxID=300266 RepID=A0A840REE7_9NEIS|nr:C13 family peptidase [Silvimonas terrae]MBB5190750.1 hypothetical protein [Silvimonas terrae]